MNSNQRMHAVLRREVPDAIPTFEWFVDAAVAKVLCGTGDAIDVAARLDLDAVNVRNNYTKQTLTENTYVTEWGMKRQITAETVDPVIESPIPDITKAADFEFPDPNAPHRFETLQRAIDTFGDEKAIVYNIRDGFSDMRDLLGYENALMGMMLEPQAFDDLLDRVVDFNLALARIAAERYGMTIIATTDDIAATTGLIFNPRIYFDRIGPRFRRVMQGYKEMGYLIIKHCDGDILQVRDHWIESGVDCLDPIDPGAGMRLDEFKQSVGDRVCLKGNVDCMGALCSGTPEEVKEEVKSCIAIAGIGGGYIISTSNTVHSGVKPENYTAMLEAVREYGTYPLKV